MAASNVEMSALLEAVATTGKEWSRQEPAAREKLLSLAHSLVAALETPSDFVHRIGIAEPAVFAAISVAIDLELFEKLSEGGDVPTTVNQLASASGADVLLIARVLKHLAAMKVVTEAGTDEYLPTRLSNAWTIPKHRDGIQWTYYATGPSLRSLPAYLQHTGYKNPLDGSDGPFQYGHSTNLSRYQWTNERPVMLERFQNHMVGRREGVIKWTDHGFYPVEERLGKDLREEKDAVLLVDVAGGLGHDLEDFRAGYPHLRGRLVLQELPVVTQEVVQINERIEVMAHDFFKPQPIKGKSIDRARAYYLHSVLHNWTDEHARNILRQLVSAMQHGYSKLLINENVVPDVGASWWITTMDMTMMAMHAMYERTERQWRELLGSVGLRVVKIWTPNPAAESLIEAELDGS